MERERGGAWRAGVGMFGVDEGVYGEWVKACMMNGRMGVWRGREGAYGEGARGVWRVGEGVYGKWA